MLCSNCGQPVGEGAAFCKNCGAPAPKSPDSATPKSPDPDATVIHPSTPPPPSSSAGGGAAPSWPPPPPPPPPGPEYPVWQPPGGPPPRRSRTGFIVGIVGAVIVVLAGAGVGSYLLVRGGDKVATTSDSGGPATMDPSSTTNTMGAATTATTIGGATGTTTGPVSTSTAQPGTTVASGGLRADYVRASADLVQLLVVDDARIPELATQINNTAPRVPQRVWDELDSMIGALDAAFTGLGEIPVPPGFEESDRWLAEATHAMSDRVYATMQGIEAMWETNRISSATEFFDQGRAARDRYRSAFQKFQNTVPVD